MDAASRRLSSYAFSPGVVPINLNRDDGPADTVRKGTDFHGVDATIDAIGVEAKGSVLEIVLTAMKWKAATRLGGVVSPPGVYAGFIPTRSSKRRKRTAGRSC